VEHASIYFIIFIIGIALVFEYLNGINNAANSIATVVSTRVLSPRLGVVWAAFFNFAAMFIFGVKVATTMGKGIVDPAVVTPTVIFAAMISAAIWTHLCTTWGLPISASHALIGGLIGAVVVKSGYKSLIMSGIIKTSVFIVLGPMIGMVLGFFIMIAIYWLFRRVQAQRIDPIFRRLQLVSAAMYSLGHGSNDAQKTMGIIAVLLYSTGHLGSKFYIPWWIIFACHFCIALGTLMGGWKVVRTMGTKITKLQPVGGCAAETAGALTIFAATGLGIPVSTTHIITGAIMGVGSTRGLSSVRWSVARQIIWAWFLTIPTSAIISAAVFFVVELF
jgi:inorganic phosphate transporter, PiT family